MALANIFINSLITMHKNDLENKAPYTLVFIILFIISSINPCMSMNNDLAYDFSPLIKVYKDGRIERLIGTTTVPPSNDPTTGVQSKDVEISREPSISARIYIPKSTTEINLSRNKPPLLVYFHGGGFCVESSASPIYHNYLSSLVAAANVVVVSVDYRLAPEHPLPIAYDDSWVALKWVGSHFDGNGTEVWLNGFADLKQVFFSGDSAGANIAHNMALKVGLEGLAGVKLIGIVLVHPHFWGTEPIGAEHQTIPETRREFMDALWRFVYPSTSGSDDPVSNPAKDPKLRELGCEKVLVFVSEKDILRDRGLYYSELLRECGWRGVVEVMEAKGEDHVFHLFNPTSENAVAMQRKMVSFMNVDGGLWLQQ